MSSSKHRAGKHRTQSFSSCSDRRPRGARRRHYATVAGRATSLAMFRLTHFHSCLMQIGPRTRCAPLPLVGRGWGWGSVSGSPHDPHPGASRRPPHKGEGRTEFVARSVAFSPASASPAAPAFAHGGGGGGAGLALEGTPFQRNGVG